MLLNDLPAEIIHRILSFLAPEIIEGMVDIKNKKSAWKISGQPAAINHFYKDKFAKHFPHF